MRGLADAFSPVFFDASSLSADDERTVHFTDETIETAETITHFLELILDGCFQVDEWFGGELRAAHLVFFLKKYQCERWITLFLSTVHHHYRVNRQGLFALFMAACVAENADIVAMLLDDDTTLGGFSKGNDNTSMLDDLATDLDVRGFDLEAWSIIPVHYLHAITKAITVVEKLNLKRKRGDIFLELVENTKS